MLSVGVGELGVGEPGFGLGRGGRIGCDFGLVERDCCLGLPLSSPSFRPTSAARESNLVAS